MEKDGRDTDEIEAEALSETADILEEMDEG